MFGNVHKLKCLKIFFEQGENNKDFKKETCVPFYFELKSIPELAIALGMDMTQVSSWMQENKLFLND